ncbi:ABC transporter ATP-binding protein [Paenibacillus sp. IITD108]|uniref:ABC transporter ATP-binding protein n=1 Tax=Paenibacillus sp. IITD108 TaxID=3116649 RepID=UPI002F41099B
MLEVSQLSKSFGGRRRGEAGKLILNRLSLRVSEGEFVSIIGPSGSGKTTLFQLIGGLELPDEGEISIAGATVTGQRGHVAYMPQQSALLPWQTVRRNIELSLTISGMPAAEARQQSQQWLQRIGLGEYADAYPQVLSGGMQQRVSFLRALLSPKPLMLLDEPFGALDALTRMEMQQWLLSIWEANRRSVLLVTHSIDEALLLSDRIIVLSAAPAVVLQELAVPFSRPRSNELWAEPAFNELKRHIYGLLHKGVESG